jgi:hypothetical protein
MKYRPVLERLVEKIRINDVTDCWEWTASKQAQGYAQISIKLLNGKHQPQLAHILTYEWLVGPVPDGMELDHLCRVRHCVNPFHLEPVPHLDNVLRGAAPTAKWSLTNTCKRGHPLRGDNVYIQKGGLRSCIICRKDRLKEFRRRNPTYNRDYKRTQKAIRDHHWPPEKPGDATPPCELKKA